MKLDNGEISPYSLLELFEMEIRKYDIPCIMEDGIWLTDAYINGNCVYYEVTIEEELDPSAFNYSVLSEMKKELVASLRETPSLLSYKNEMTRKHINIIYVYKKHRKYNIMDKMQLKALAKINLGLDVLRRREDGYHEVRMIMQTVRIFDRLQLMKQERPGIRVRTNLYYLPANENNLVYKAANLLFEEFGLPGGLSIDLKKYIPVAAGMAGGSSDAAAVLYGVNRMYGLGLSQEELMKRGVRIGADVPYCLMRGTALAEGIGEVLSPLPPMPPCNILVAKPGISVSTKFVYENLHANELRADQHPDIDGILEALRRQDLKGMTECMKDGNVLETVTVPAHPVIQKIKDTMEEQGALAALMSGSGPTVFGIFEDRNKARRAMSVLRKNRLAKQLFLTTPYNNRRGTP